MTMVTQVINERLKMELHLWDSKSSDSGGQVIQDSSESGRVDLVVFSSVVGISSLCQIFPGSLTPPQLGRWQDSTSWLLCSWGACD